MKNFWQEVLLLPYISNSQDNPHHEHKVRDLLDLFGYQYVYQPNGTHKSPDFRVFLPNGKVVEIECKTCKDPQPVYNGGLPKEGVVYIFTSEKYNETTIFFAEDIIIQPKRKLYKNLIKDLKAVLKSYQLKEEWKNDPRGFDFYIRNMYIQKGGEAKTNYFKHADRKRCEQKVLNYNW